MSIHFTRVYFLSLFSYFSSQIIMKSIHCYWGYIFCSFLDYIFPKGYQIIIRYTDNLSISFFRIPCCSNSAHKKNMTVSIIFWVLTWKHSRVSITLTHTWPVLDQSKRFKFKEYVISVIKCPVTSLLGWAFPNNLTPFVSVKIVILADVQPSSKMACHVFIEWHLYSALFLLHNFI